MPGECILQNDEKLKKAYEVPELIVGSVAPVLWKQKCSDGVECKDCNFNAGGTDLRKKMPTLPPCFKVAMNEQMEWSERRLEGDGKLLEEEEEEGELEQETREQDESEGVEDKLPEKIPRGRNCNDRCRRHAVRFL